MAFSNTERLCSFTIEEKGCDAGGVALRQCQSGCAMAAGHTQGLPGWTLLGDWL